MTPTLRALLLCFAIMTFWPAAAAFGQSGLALDSSVNASNSTGPVTFNVTSAGPVLTNPGISIATGTGSASASGSVQFGSISGNASVTGNSGATPNAGAASFEGIWEDTLTVTSTTLAPDTTVDLLFTMTYNFSTVCSGPNASPSEEAEFEAGSQNVTASNTTCNPTSQGTQTLNLVTFVGGTTDILGDLTLEPVAGEGSSVQEDPPVNFYIDSETPGASYTTASGTDYFTPISPTPEPSTFGLFGIGLLGLIALRKKAVA
jgi:hypothetical protein